MDREFNIYGYSNHSKDVYPNNTSADFVISLPKPIHLEGEWECGFVQFYYTASTDKPFYVCCDLVHESHVGDFKLPILRRVQLKTTQFAHVIYAPMKTRDFNSIRVYMRTWKNKPAKALRGPTYFTLHFRRLL